MTEHDLRWRLRQLPRELDPPADAWPGIAARLRSLPAAPAAPRRPRAWPGLLALAACLCLAVGVAGWQRSGPAPAAPDLAEQLVQGEARALVAEYEAALREMQDVPVPEPLAPALATLDASALEIRSALAAQPDSVNLLDQLKRTYARRLALTQRAALG